MSQTQERGTIVHLLSVDTQKGCLLPPDPMLRIPVIQVAEQTGASAVEGLRA